MAKEKNEVGVVTHWYDKINVAVIKLSGKLSVGDKIKIKRGDEECEEVVSSMQFDHEEIKSGKKGQEIAIKLTNKAKDGAIILLQE
jgi:translation initiation factor IF-2